MRRSRSVAIPTTMPFTLTGSWDAVLLQHLARVQHGILWLHGDHGSFIRLRFMVKCLPSVVLGWARRISALQRVEMVGEQLLAPPHRTKPGVRPEPNRCITCALQAVAAASASGSSGGIRCQHDLAPHLDRSRGPSWPGLKYHPDRRRIAMRAIVSRPSMISTTRRNGNRRCSSRRSESDRGLGRMNVPRCRRPCLPDHGSPAVADIQPCSTVSAARAPPRRWIPREHHRQTFAT